MISYEDFDDELLLQCRVNCLRSARDAYDNQCTRWYASCIVINANQLLVGIRNMCHQFIELLLLFNASI